jgi:subtilisin family serine protease
MRGKPGVIAVSLVLLLGAAVSTAAAAVMVAFPARFPKELPSPPPGKLAPGFQKTVERGAQYVGLTTGGLTVIELPPGERIEDVRPFLPGVILFSGPPPNQELDKFDEVVLLYDAATSPPALGTKVLGMAVLRRNDSGRFAVVKVGNPISASLLQRLADLPGIRFVEPNYRYRFTFTASLPPNDPEYITDTPWGLDKIHAPSAWTIVHDSPVPVAIIDTGIDINHLDLVGNLFVNTGEIPGNGVDDDGNGCIDDVFGCDFVSGGGDVTDTSGHGTWVAGIIGAVGNNGRGTVGVGWHVPLLAVRVAHSDTEWADPPGIHDGIEYALMRGARVLNASWSAGGAESVTVSDAISDADNQGALFIASTGDKGQNLDLSPVYPASYAHANIIAVAATTSDDQLSVSSGFGQTSVHLGAPGMNIKTTLLENNYGLKDGTSFAVPYVSGAVALVWGHPAYSGWSAHAVRDLLLSKVSPLKSLAGKCTTGGQLDLQFLSETTPQTLPPQTLPPQTLPPQTLPPQTLPQQTS